MKPQDYAADAVSHGCMAIDLDGQVQSFTESIRDALIARGELTCRDGVWYVATHGVLDMMQHAPWLACCDFCSGRPVVWNLPCASFRLGDGWSAEDWAACEKCGALIVAGDRRALLQRAIAASSDKPHAALWLPMLRELHHKFWRHRRGEPTRIPPRPFGH